MAKGKIGKAPFPVQAIDLDGPLSAKRFNEIFDEAKARTLCVRSAKGHPDRGGYFFHLERVSGGFRIYDFRKALVGTRTAEETVRLVNHVTGRCFDEEMFAYCQATINLRKDQTDSD